MTKLFVSYDAGGAAVISAYRKIHCPKEMALMVCDGPACECFRNNGWKYRRILNDEYFLEGLRDAIHNNGITEAYCSTGAYNYELDAMKELSAHNIITYTLIENWTSYRERFGYPDEDWKNNLPTKVIAFDSRAVELALSYGFPKDKIILKDNPFNMVIKKEYKDALNRICNDKILFTILYLSDQLGLMADRLCGDRDGFGFDELSLLDDICSAVSMNSYPNVELIIRTHPAEKQEKYADNVGAWIKLSDQTDLVDDLARADVVIGCFTSALVTSAVVGKPTIFYLPHELIKGRFKEIDMNHVEGLTNIYGVERLSATLATLIKHQL